MMPFVSYWDNVLSKEYCSMLIDKFEKNIEQQQDTVLENHRSFKEINLNQNEGWSDDINKLLDEIQNTYLQKYMIEHKVDSNTWPTELGFEEFRFKRYMPNDVDEFKFHVDVQDWQSASRFLVCFFYLNDVEEGGETAFQPHRMLPVSEKIKPVTGRLLMFPPLWTHPHAGLKPVSGPKYILGTYLRYI
jgi:hypothetical protein